MSGNFFNPVNGSESAPIVAIGDSKFSIHLHVK